MKTIAIVATNPEKKNVVILAVRNFSIPVLIQIIVNNMPAMMVSMVEMPLKRFQKRVYSMTTEKVPPMPAQT